MKKIKIYLKVLFWSFVLSFIILSCFAVFVQITNLGDVKFKGFMYALAVISIGMSIPAYCYELEQIKNN